MAQLSKKIQQDLNDLPSGWVTRADLVKKMCKDNHVIDLVRNVTSLPGEPRMDFSDPINGLLKHLFMGTSWRLTLFGCAFMLKTYKAYSLSNVSNMQVNGRILINLGRLIRGPWHVHNTVVNVWDQSTHFELSMFDGNIHRYVDFNLPK